MSLTPAMLFSRSQVLCPIFGKPEDLKRNLQILPKVYWFDIQDSGFSNSNMENQFCANRVKTPCG